MFVDFRSLFSLLKQKLKPWSNELRSESLHENFSAALVLQSNENHSCLRDDKS